MTSPLLRKTDQNIYGYVREFGCYAKRYFKQKSFEPSTRFLIFGRGRSGSTLLVSLLNSCPGLYCDKEILNRKVLSPRRFVDCRSGLFQKDIYGFKLLSYQLRSVQAVSPLDFLTGLNDTGYKTIFLIRENALRQCLSKMYAAHRSQWHQKEKQKKVEKMTVDLIQLKNNLEESKRLENFEYSLMDRLPHLTISYEQDLLIQEQHENTIQKISQYLGIPDFTPRTDLKKITTEDFSDFITNSEEMIGFLEKNGYRKYLEDGSSAS